MSSATPPSFVDDGGSFQKRIRRGLHPAHVANWVSSSGSDTTSAYTGSHIDDGADMLHPSKQGPGFGQINPRFYKQRKRKEGKEGLWNDDIQKAVTGDIQRSLEKLRGVRDLEVKRPRREQDVEEHKSGNKDTITIPLPPKWGTFVIRAEHGRVIVIDEDGEFDSGPQKYAPQQPAKWVKAPTTIATPSIAPLSPKRSSSGGSGKKRKNKRKHEHISLPAKSLTPIPESEYEDGYIPSAGEDLGSPTDFFMTGGLSGWPSHPATSVASTSKSAKAYFAGPLAAWKLAIATAVAGEHKEHDKASVKSYSTYRPATVEDALDTSSENALRVKEVLKVGSQKGSATGWDGSTNGWDHSAKGSHKSASRSNKAADDEPWNLSQAASEYGVNTSVHNWVGNRVKTVSEASTHKPRSRSHRSHSLGRAIPRAPTEEGWETSAKGSEVSWDGYEIPKTLSEVSVAGTGSQRSWPGSQTSSRHHGSRVSSHRSDRSHKTSKHGSNIGWGEKFANGYDEDDETYLNESWGGVKVRVGSRRESIAG
ncbi:hypothetical protein FB567DRAFT_562700 [Paraphoma chrysanthemicola]|uniref:Uncharacterized protein n=1 Tax=Paraphoma chrysanthemicola TaxID=798071 RepID=A0A8K0QZG8_9PLEO|nr:hypothetical protein FB567DRAFT_562700 [Paraphoma chrysanthemicola]